MLSHAVRPLTLMLGLGLMSGPNIAQAGTVVSDSGKTVITIGGKRDRLSGQYRSQVNGVTWTGSFLVTLLLCRRSFIAKAVDESLFVGLIAPVKLIG